MYLVFGSGAASVTFCTTLGKCVKDLDDIGNDEDEDQEEEEEEEEQNKEERAEGQDETPHRGTKRDDAEALDEDDGDFVDVVARILARESCMATAPYNTKFWTTVYPTIIRTALENCQLEVETYPILALKNCQLTLKARHIPIKVASPPLLVQLQPPRAAAPQVAGHFANMTSAEKRTSKKGMSDPVLDHHSLRAHTDL